ncbi:MAG TPA: hypothetical protein EYQ86_00915 [Bacteroidetes bacterium]|nr:hypothetical protein [Bacteroidota bacterium]
MLNEPDGQKESNLIFSKKIQYISIVIILIAGIMIYIVKPERFNKAEVQKNTIEEVEDTSKQIIEADTTNYAN